LRRRTDAPANACPQPVDRAEMLTSQAPPGGIVGHDHHRPPQYVNEMAPASTPIRKAWEELSSSSARATVHARAQDPVIPAGRRRLCVPGSSSPARAGRHRGPGRRAHGFTGLGRRLELREFTEGTTPAAPREGLPEALFTWVSWSAAGQGPAAPARQPPRLSSSGARSRQARPARRDRPVQRVAPRRPHPTSASLRHHVADYGLMRAQSGQPVLSHELMLVGTTSSAAAKAPGVTSAATKPSSAAAHRQGRPRRHQAASRRRAAREGQLKAPSTPRRRRTGTAPASPEDRRAAVRSTRRCRAVPAARPILPCHAHRRASHILPCDATFACEPTFCPCDASPGASLSGTGARGAARGAALRRIEIAGSAGGSRRSWPLCTPARSQEHPAAHQARRDARVQLASTVRPAEPLQHSSDCPCRAPPRRAAEQGQRTRAGPGSPSISSPRCRAPGTAVDLRAQPAVLHVRCASSKHTTAARPPALAPRQDRRRSENSGRVPPRSHSSRMSTISAGRAGEPRSGSLRQVRLHEAQAASRTAPPAPEVLLPELACRAPQPRRRAARRALPQRRT